MKMDFVIVGYVLFNGMSGSALRQRIEARPLMSSETTHFTFSVLFGN
jgi:hypothetical protein